MASGHSEENMSELKNIISSVGLEKLWLGLPLHVGSWRWSLKKECFYVQWRRVQDVGNWYTVQVLRLGELCKNG